MEKSIIEKLGITSGPWRVVECGNFSGTYVSFVSKGDTTLFQSRHPESIYSAKRCDNDSQLISAAPEMLEALIGSIYEIDRFDVPEVEILRDVIQKATGKSWEEIKELM